MEILHVGVVTSGPFWTFLLLVVVLSSKHTASESLPTLGNETDRLSLLAFKDGLTFDPLSAMQSWNQTLPFCSWAGVTCDSADSQRVTALNLTGQRLMGPLSPHISNLTFLSAIDLSNNSFRGKIPQQIGGLFRLQHLNLSGNSFDGEIPVNLSRCLELRALDLHQNQLGGYLPTQLGSLSNLNLLALEMNNFTGNIPPSLGNLSSLTRLTLQRNILQGTIPDHLGRMTSLKYLRISFNNLVGAVPQSLFNLSSLNYFNVAANRLEGNLPPNIGLALPNIQILVVAGNRFTGPIPMSLPNATTLQSVDIANNNFNGSVPLNIGRLNNLFRLSIQINQLGSGEAGDMNFLTSLTNCSGLRILGLGYNRFGGELPDSIANFSTQLSELHLANTQISGRIPTGIENLVGLTLLLLNDNRFQGTIPVEIGKLRNLKEFRLNGNRLSGQIPSSLGNITQLNRLVFSGNSFHGSIPSNLGNCQNLQNLDLSKNQLTGRVPKQIFSISGLTVLALSDNSLSGPLTMEDSNLTNLEIFDVSKNRISGEIPSMLGKCRLLQYLYMADNLFQGVIPPSLSNLTHIQGLDLSSNSLSGGIPKYFGEFGSLQYLNVSFNQLEGEVPKQGIFTNGNGVLALGNNKLCGSGLELQLPACPAEDVKRTGRSTSRRAVIAAVSAASFVILCAFVFASLYLIRKSRRKRFSASASDDSFLKVSYAHLLQATNGFSSANLVGVGSYGSVYKGVLNDDNDMVIAVKVLNLQHRGASRSFEAECEALRNIRHRNLVKVLTTCSSIDFKGNDFKALVFDYMPNGSLEKWLHPSTYEQLYVRNLSLMERLNIAIDVATALDYLHHHCQTPIAHCDLKPSNILLGNDMSAHVSDFGIARILYGNPSDSLPNQTNTIGINGSIGYVAPEYGMGGKVSTHGDVYSYGILLLEMFTGKKPTDDMFKDGLSLHQLAKTAFPDQIDQIADPRILLEEVDSIGNEEIHKNARFRMRECLVSVIRVGLSCSAESPKNRMKMQAVVVEMHAIREIYLGVNTNKEILSMEKVLDGIDSYLLR